MSEQEAAPEVPQEPTNEVETPTSEVEVNEIEDIARDNGWAPDKGDLTAAQFLRNGKRFQDRDRSTIKELREEVGGLYNIVAENITSQKEEKYESRKSTWERQFNEAVESGDTARVAQLRKNQPRKPVQEKAPPKADPEAQFVDTWMADNTWFKGRMKDMALGFYESQKHQHGTDQPSVILPRVKEMMEEAFPAEFAPPSNPNASRGAGVEKGGKQSKSSGGGLKRSDLTEAEGSHLDQFIKAGMSEKSLLASIARNRR